MLVGLRGLGQNATADNINELTGIEDSSVLRIYKNFCKYSVSQVRYMPAGGSDDLKPSSKNLAFLVV